MWASKNQGRTWAKVRDLTKNSIMNHHYVRRALNAHPDFYAFWADGDAFKPSKSKLYFCTKDGEVRVLPYTMTRDFMMPHAYGETHSP